MYMGNVAHFLCKCSFWCDNSLKRCLLFWANCVPTTRISCSDLFSLAKLWWLYIANKIFSPMSSQTTIFGFIPSDFQSSDANDLVGTNRWMQVPCNHGNKTLYTILNQNKIKNHESIFNMYSIKGNKIQFKLWYQPFIWSMKFNHWFRMWFV